MKNNKLGTFTEETYKYGKIFYLQTRQTTPCTEEEKRIYGVDVKLDSCPQDYKIIQYNCHDGGTFYEIRISWESFHPSYFQDLNTAKEYLINKAKSKELL